MLRRAWAAVLVSVVLPAVATCAPEPPCADPARLACTGLYQDDRSQGVLAPGVRPFTPGYSLWSDGLEKSRYIFLPAGARIDTSDSDEWTFPVGTKMWKEFRWRGRRIETRLMEKLAPGNWSRSTFVWNLAGTDARLDCGGKTITLPGSRQPYDIPSHADCARCHDGRRDSILGFEAIALAAPLADGVTLEQLAAENLVTRPIDLRRARLGGGAVDAEALGWLHVNCGVSCHNTNPAASASFLGLDLKLAASALGDPRQAAAVRTAAEQPTMALGFRDPRVPRLRISPGHPEASAVFVRATSRSPALAMPPLASHVADPRATTLLRKWILSLRPRGAAVPSNSTAATSR
ncbi:MAG: hypothetical protein ABUL77_00090 [Bacteroidota bacterium]